MAAPESTSGTDTAGTTVTEKSTSAKSLNAVPVPPSAPPKIENSLPENEPTGVAAGRVTAKSSIGPVAWPGRSEIGAFA
jgi:hypothetical protein